MDFFASQEHARRNTKWLVFYFVLAIASMVLGIYLVVAMATGELINVGLFAIVAGSVASVVGCGSAYKVATLRGGGESVAAMLGGRYLPPNSPGVAERRILNIVEEMALAAGTPVPPVYIMEHEEGINAFAAGYTVDDAVIGLNRGTIELLTRDELQGVVAHEFSHILNGDMRISIRMIGILHGIQVLSLIGYYLLRSMSFRGHRRSDDGKGAAGIMAFAFAVIVIGSVGMFFARLIKSAVSRQREFLADASAVQFTRNPEGIAGALKMISAVEQGSLMISPQAEEASHMFFGSMFGAARFNMFATHPPLDKRIRAIDPQFDGDLTDYLQQRQRQIDRKESMRRRREQPKEKKASPFGADGGMFGFPGMMGDQFPIDPTLLIAGIGMPDNDDVEYSKVIVDRIPEELAMASRDLFSARCLVFGSLLDGNSQVRQKQIEILAKQENPATVRETQRLLPFVEKMEPRFRLPVFEILQGTLTGISPEQYSHFRSCIDSLIASDQRVDLFEFFLQRHLMVHLDRRFGLLSPPKVAFRAMTPLKQDICLLLHVLATIGHDESELARQAMAAGIESLGQTWEDTTEASVSHTNFKQAELNTAIDRLNQASLKIKKRFLTAAAVVITFDKQVRIAEAEMFRALSESLDCPVPPVVADAN